MGGIYRQTDANGQVTFSDQPPARAGDIETLGRDGRRTPQSKADSTPTHEEVKRYIKDTQKYVPKVREYFEYLEFLRSHSPARHRLMLEALKREDIQAYSKLLLRPEFRPLKETAFGWRATERNVTAAASVVTGKFTGSVEKWLETTVQQMMKQQRWGGYADVLGDKATTLATKAASASNTHWGKFVLSEEPKMASARKAARVGLEASRAAIRSGLAASISRVGNTALGGGIEMLDAEKATSVGTVVLREKARRLFEKGVLDASDWEETQHLLSQGKYKEMQKLMDDAVSAHIQGTGR